MTTRAALEAAGMLPLAETICRHYGATLESALCGNHIKHKSARFVLLAVLSNLGWTDERIMAVTGMSQCLLDRALDEVHISQVRRFVPMRQS